MNLPYSALMVMMNENLKVYFKPEKRRLKFMWYFLCASIAGKTSEITGG